MTTLVVILLLLAACAEPLPEAPSDGVAPSPATTGEATTGQATAALKAGALETTDASEPGADRAPGTGFVVWESNRTGVWRLWIRDLDGSPPRQLWPEAGDRPQCCAHIEPGGERIAYLSLPPGDATYPEGGASGRLQVIRRPAMGSNAETETATEAAPRVVVPDARTYFEHRAVVWRDVGELIYIAGDGRTRWIQVDTGEQRDLTDARVDRHGWLVNRQLTHATTGLPSFAPYDKNRRQVRETRTLGGCQPYFSHDGRWGFWTAGAGGPIRAMDLATRHSVEILAKSDPRLPDDRGYLYFPMFSHDATLFAWGASPDQHDHATSDYDIFVAATDPETLELLGPPWRVTRDPGSDRFPDVFAAPLALGRHFGEAPLRLELTAPDAAEDWVWQLGETIVGEATATLPLTGPAIEHTFEAAGTYAITARRGGETAQGWARVRPAQPPSVVDTVLRGGREIVIRFDEAVDPATATAAFESGRLVMPDEDGLLSEDPRSLVITLAQDLDEGDTLLLTGVQDRAQRPNLMPPTRLPIEPASWPLDARGLVFLWQTDDGFNEVDDPAMEAPRACLLKPRGRAWLDRHFAMVLAGGMFVTDDASVLGVLNGCQRTNELTLEATITPHRRAGPDMARIVTFSGGHHSRNFTLGQIDDRLIFRLRTATTGPNADRPQLDLGPLPIGRPTHVVVSYTAGRLTAWLDGRQVLDSDAVQDGFFHWQARPLVFGNEWQTSSAGQPSSSPAPSSSQAPHAWHGAIEGVAMYDRAFGSAEANESFRRYAELRAERLPTPQGRVRAVLRQRSSTPSMREIAPYREALAVYEYEVQEVLEGDVVLVGDGKGAILRVVHRVLVDGDTLPVSRRAAAQSYELTLEPFIDHPELESLYLADTLPERPDLQLLFSAEIAP